MRTLFILMDSLNRHHLPLYGGSLAKTPNIERLAERGVVFDNHWAGSLPCMPARRELMTGRHNFLETPWSPIMPWDDCLPVELRKQCDTYSHLITDHYHYFHHAGECYHTLFSSWEFERGQEGDAWRPLVTMPEVPETRGKGGLRKAYWRNREFMDPEDDLSYPTPRCFERAIDFLKVNRDADNWHLHLEVFDPHEPFDCPTKYRELHQDTWDKYHYTWPAYAALDPELDDPEAVEHIRKCYAGTLSMTDAWLGRLLDVMDEQDMWKDTTVILTTDHGHMLGEHGYWAKNYQMDYAELARIPLVVCHPDAPMNGRRVNALTSAIDMMPTLMDLFGAEELPPFVRGKSIRPLLENDGTHHDAVLYGYFGKDVNLTDGRITYCRQPVEGSVVHHHTLIPTGSNNSRGRESLKQAEHGVFLKTAHGVPHLRWEVASRRHHGAPEANLMYDIQADPGQQSPLHDDALEARLAGTMRELLHRHDAPACQYMRLGL